MRHINLNFEDYLALDGVSKSQLDLINKSPAHYQWYKENGFREATSSMIKGSLVHQLFLEPKTFNNTYAVLPADIKVKRGKAFEAFKEDNLGQTIITETQLNEANMIVQAIQSNKKASSILESAIAVEESITTEDFGGLLKKCRLDIRTRNAIYDLKTTQNAKEESFISSARKYRYDVQAAYYYDICKAEEIPVEKFGFIVVDTVEYPFQCTVFDHVSEETLANGREKYTENLKTLYKCMETGEYPGYPEFIEELNI